MIKKILIVLTVVLNLILPLNVFAETTTENIQELEKGQGTVKELVKDGTREFFTITTVNGSTFYLVIDKDKSNENVYFLKAVNEIDLIELAGQNAVIYESTETTTESTTTETTTENISQTVEIEEKSDSSFGFIEILAFIGFIVLIIYLLFNKIKGKSKKHTFDDEDDDEETENNNNDDTINNNTENESQTITGLINKDID